MLFATTAAVLLATLAQAEDLHKALGFKTREGYLCVVPEYDGNSARLRLQWNCRSPLADVVAWGVGDGQWKIEFAKKLLLDVADGDSSNGRTPQVWQEGAWGGNSNQRFEWISDGNKVRIRTPGGYACLDVRDGRAKAGEYLQWYYCADSNPNQLFHHISVEKGRTDWRRRYD